MAIKHQYDDDEMESLVINVHPELRKRLMLIAAQNNMSLQEYVEELLEQAASTEEVPEQEQDKGLSSVAVARLLQYHEEMRRVHPGEIVKDSTELLREAREERMRELEQR